MNALEIVDAAARGPFLIVGMGRDLDVLAPAESLEAIREALRRNGFVPRRTTWARFAPFELVDLRPLEDDALVAGAAPLDGFVHARRADDPRRKRGRVGARLRRIRESGVVALSGVDGAGKSMQAELLRDTLVATGFDAVVEWNRLAHDRWLDAVAGVVKRVLRRRPSPSGSRGAAAPSAGRSPRPGGWVVLLSLANAFAHLRSVRRHAVAGRIVVCDRYVLDSIVDLRTTYPPGVGQRLARALVLWLSPRPRAAFLLAVPADVAYERKPRPGRQERLAAQADAYDTEAARLGVITLDATRPVDELAAEIARETWRRV